jgi:zinc protease
MQSAAVTDGSFGQEVLGAVVPVLVKFYAEGPSAHAANTVLDEIAQKFDGRIKVTSIDVARNPMVKAEYQIRGLPTFILFKNGKPLARRIGGQLRKEDVEEWVNAALIGVLASRRTSTVQRGIAFKLSNGMLGLVIPDHRAAIVTHMVWYRVGAADEPQGLSGIAHFLGYLTFKSMEKTADGAATAISLLGGQSNGSSQRDITVYHQRISREHLRAVMEMEAGRMVQLRLTDDEVAVAREVLTERRRSTLENDAGVGLSEEIDDTLYQGHRHGIPVMGLPDETARITLEDASRFQKLHYAPNNAVLVVSGDVTLEEVKWLAEETYGKLPANPEARGRSRPQVPVHIADHRVVVENFRTATAEFRRRYAVPGYVEAVRGEAHALEVLARVLAGGSASRLYRKLVIEDKSASTVGGDYRGLVVDSGAISIYAVANNGDLRALEAGVDALLLDIRKNGVTQEELASAKSALLAGYIYDSSDQFKLAQRYGLGLALGLTLDAIEDWPTEISKVTAADIRRAATTYLIDRRAVTGWLVPDKYIGPSVDLGRAHR